MQFRFAKDSRIQPPTPEQWEEADRESSILALSRGTHYDGTHYYAFINVYPSRYEEFYRLSRARQPIDLTQYGDIITGGAEAEPPQHVLKIMIDEYGFDPEFEQKLEAEFQKQRNAHSSRAEESRLMDIVAMMQKKPNSLHQSCVQRPKA
jgi:hypothetical protein